MPKTYQKMIIQTDSQAISFIEMLLKLHKATTINEQKLHAKIRQDLQNAMPLK